MSPKEKVKEAKILLEEAKKTWENSNIFVPYIKLAIENTEGILRSL